MQLQIQDERTVRTITSSTIFALFMHVKDYYKALELQPSATLAEIKSAYRKLAHVSHPDKNQDDPYAAARFNEIKEAYEVLTNPSKKDLYLQKRWYNQSTGSRKSREMITPVSVLKQALELNQYVSKLDAHRMDKMGLSDYIDEMLTPEVIEKVNRFGEPGTNSEIIKSLLNTAQVLPISQFTRLSENLKHLTTDPIVIADIDRQLASLHRQERWENFMPWILLLITIVICIVIFMLNR